MVERIQDSPYLQDSSRSNLQNHPGAEGRYRGERAVHKDIQSLIADAAEEVTFSVSDRLEKKESKKKLSDRRLKSTAAETAEKYLKKVPDIGEPKKLRSFLNRLKKAGPMTSKDLRRAVAEFSDHAPERFAALSYAKDMLAEEGGHGESVQALEGEIGRLLEEHGPEIRSHIHVHETASDALESDFSDGELGRFYEEVQLQHEGLTETCTALMTTHSKEDFTKAVEFMIKAAGTRLQAGSARISDVELQKTVDDLFKLEVLGSLHEECADLIRKMEDQTEIAADLTPRYLMTEILQAKDEKWLQSDRILKIAEKAAPSGDEENAIYFSTELLKLIRDLPIKVYESTESRQKLIDVVQEALDIQIEQEEEGLE